MISQSKMELGLELERISKKIKNIKIDLRHVSKLYNEAYSKSIINEGRFVAREVMENKLPDYINLAKTCTSLEEWRTKYSEGCNSNSHSLEVGSCDCAWDYRMVGGDNLYLVFRYESKLNRIKEDLSKEKFGYKHTLALLKSQNNKP